MKDTRPAVQQWEDVCESVFMGGRYTEYNLWTDKIAAASANVIKTIKWEKAAGIRWFFSGTTAFFFLPDSALLACRIYLFENISNHCFESKYERESVFPLNFKLLCWTAP